MAERMETIALRKKGGLLCDQPVSVDQRRAERQGAKLTSSPMRNSKCSGFATSELLKKEAARKDKRTRGQTSGREKCGEGRGNLRVVEH